MGVILGTIAIVAITIALGMLIDRKRPLLPAPEDFGTSKQREQSSSHRAGEAPATALRVRAAQVTRLRSSQRCASCRAPMTNDADDHVRYGDANLLVLHFTCAGCGSKRSLYIDLVSS